jgi:arabinose-5-phosphate isomerase
MSGTIEIAKNIFTLEARAINDLKKLLTEDFDRVIQIIKHSKGRLVITGMGKSGHIGKKIAATLASTGTPSFFMHPAEAIHGDLGMLTSDDILLAISNSGESDEIVKIIPLVKSRNIALIAMVGNLNSTLAISVDYLLNISIEKEACPLSLAPMSSTTVTLAMGDAIAGALMVEKGFKAEDFAMYHLGGSLGKRLLTKVKDIMHTKELPIVDIDDNFSMVIKKITRGKLGLCIVKEDTTVIGIITDGDLRRALEGDIKSRFEFKASDMMTKNPKTISSNQMAIDAKNIMIENKINELPVLDNDELVGIVQIYDMGVI